MTCLPHEGMYFDHEWTGTSEFEDTLNYVYPKNMRSRKVYGLLDAPLVPSIAADLYSYKLFVVGKAQAGKTSLVQQLCAGQRGATTLQSSPGIITDHVFWPCRLRSGELLLFRLELWDADDYALRRYPHTLPTLQQRADGAIFVFSACDRQSLDEVPGLMSRTLEVPSCADLCRFVVGTGFDDAAHCEVPLRELDAFRRHWGLPVFRAHADGVAAGPHAPLRRAAALLTYVCESLWHRDKLLAAAGPA